MAHLAVHLAARLPVHPARGQPRVAPAHIREPRDRHASRRALARGTVDFRHLGRDPRLPAGVRALAREESNLRASAPAASGAVHIRGGADHLGVLPCRDARGRTELHRLDAGDRRALRGLAACRATAVPAAVPDGHGRVCPHTPAAPRHLGAGAGGEAETHGTRIGRDGRFGRHPVHAKL